MPWSTGKQGEEKKTVWPKVPKELKYSRVHLCDANPWCAYVMIHNNTVAATSLTATDIFHFPFKHQTNDEIFGKGDFSSENLLRFKQEIELILENNKEVVAKNL